MSSHGSGAVDGPASSRGAQPGRLGSGTRTILSLSGVPTLSHEEMPRLLPTVQEEASHLPSAPLPLPLEGRECPLRSPSGTPWRQLGPPSLYGREAPPILVIRTRAPEATPPLRVCLPTCSRSSTWELHGHASFPAAFRQLNPKPWSQDQGPVSS